MTKLPTTTSVSLTISELSEFATFGAATQRYIKRSLDVGLCRRDAFALWSRDAEETASIRRQYLLYQDLKFLREDVPHGDAANVPVDFLARLVRLATFDLAQEKLESFSAFRFLYERLISAGIRPWLPSAFCGAAALPKIRPERRRTLLQSISEAAATAPGWSDRPPAFFPEWVEKADMVAG